MSGLEIASVSVAAFCLIIGPRARYREWKDRHRASGWVKSAQLGPLGVVVSRGVGGRRFNVFLTGGLSVFVGHWALLLRWTAD